MKTPRPSSTRRPVPYPGERSCEVLVSTHYYSPAFRGGGPIQTLRALVSAAPPTYEVSILCSNFDLGHPEPLVEKPNQWMQVGRASIRYVQGGLLSLIRAYRSRTDIVILYLNSLFDPRYSILPLMLYRLGFWSNAVIVLAPRGELSPGALKLKPWKKRLFLRTSKVFRIHRNILWHASTSHEADFIRAQYGPKTEVLIRENETSLPLESLKRRERTEGPARLLFASRLVPKKGLLILLQALAATTAPLELNIVGSFEDAVYETECRRAIENLSEKVTVRILGAIPHEAVLEQMRQADLLVFPTAGENFGHVIAEALSEGCPVLVSDHTPWSERLPGAGCDIVRPNTPTAWEHTIEQFLQGGSSAWQAAARQAAFTYDDWAAEDKGEHIFELAMGSTRTLGT